MRWIVANLTFAALVMTAFLGASPAAALVQAGSVQEIRVYGYGTIPGKSRSAVYERDDVYMDEVLETVTDGAMRVLLLDDTALIMGSKSVLTIDEMVYDPATKDGEQVINFTVGAFRFISGKLNKQKVTLRTPTMVIGIRGTDITITVGPDGTTDVSVNSGSITATSVAQPDAGGTDVTEGNSVTCAPGQAVGPVTAASPRGTGDPNVDDSEADGSLPPDPDAESTAGGGGSGGGGH